MTTFRSTGVASLRKVPQRFVLGALALASVGCAAGTFLHGRWAADPNIVVAQTAPAERVASNPFGEMIVEPGWGSKSASPNPQLSPLPSLEAFPPAPAAAAVPPAPSASIPLPKRVPLPPKRDVPQVADTPPLPEIADTAPLPPPRPAEFAAPPSPAAQERPTAQKSGATTGAAAPADNRNIFQKLFAFALPSGSAAVSSAPQGRGAGRGPLAAFPPPFGTSAPAAGYDRFTAVYDISARTLYLPDGTKLEAHSGLGDRLDDPRFVNERARGATPPNVYELTPRETSFHGVQALRLTPVGEGAIYGRAGLLAHPYMLGPNGDSNGCVSVKDYEAFLRAYQNGQVKRLAVVARL